MWFTRLVEPGLLGDRGFEPVVKRGNSAHSLRIFPGVSIWRYGPENIASKNFLAPKAVFAAPDNSAAG